MILFFYTYGGDNMVNNFLLGQEIDSRNYIPEKDLSDVDTPYVRFLSSKIYPLSLFLYKDLVGCPQIKDLLMRHGMIPADFKAKVELLWKKVKTKSFHQAYQTLYFFFVENREDFPSVILKNYTQEFTNTLINILHRVPKTNIQFWVFRGISKKDYVVIGNEKRYVFTNKPFMSTSLDLCQSAYFKNQISSCCIQQILVPKGVSCLFISLLSSFRYEKEILFPPNSYLFPISDDYLATNVNIETRKFTIAN